MADVTQPAEGEPQIRAIAMLADANPSGDICVDVYVRCHR
jgi:hypothetical protein